MELIFAVLGGLIIGLIVRYSLPGRDLTGAILVPAVATAGAAILWEIATWLKLPSDNAWVWIVVFAIVAIKSVFIDLWLSRRRKQADEQAYQAALKGASRV
ncbi:MAG: hypothetical protein RLZZ600_1054 [Actinomycetota bacterium]|jgi:membrane protein implicated in regulation of membrane protease activity